MKVTEDMVREMFMMEGTQAQAAEKLGVCISTVCKYRKGKIKRTKELEQLRLDKARTWGGHKGVRKLTREDVYLIYSTPRHEQQGLVSKLGVTRQAISLVRLGRTYEEYYKDYHELGDREHYEDVHEEV